jgi:hypothetical protein
MKVNRTLQVSLDQADVETAILAYIESQGIDLAVDGMHTVLTFTSARQPNGIRVSVDMVEDAQPKQARNKRTPAVSKPDTEIFAKPDSDMEGTGSADSAGADGEATDAPADAGGDDESAPETDGAEARPDSTADDSEAAAEASSAVAVEPKNTTSLFGSK